MMSHSRLIEFCIAKGHHLVTITIKVLNIVPKYVTRYEKTDHLLKLFEMR